MYYTIMQYVNEQYKKLGISLEDFDHSDWFNPNIYWGFTPPRPPLCYEGIAGVEGGGSLLHDREVSKCASCSTDFTNFKSGYIEDDMEVEWSHPTSCLWFDYFSDKVKQSCKRPKFVKKAKRSKH